MGCHFFLQGIFPEPWIEPRSPILQVDSLLTDPLGKIPLSMEFSRKEYKLLQLEWVAIPFSREFLDPVIEPESTALQGDSLPSEPPGKPNINGSIYYNSQEPYMAKQKKRHRCTEQTFELCGRRQGWDISREQHRNMYII